MIEPIGALVMLAGFISLFLPQRFGIALLICLTILQAAAAFTIPGSANIMPAQVMLAWVICKIVSDPKCRADFSPDLLVRGGGLWLAATVIYAVLGAFFLPRLWSGQLETFPVGTAGDPTAIPLGPRTSNVTQSLYLVGDLACYLIVAAFVRSHTNFQVVTFALLAYGVLNITFAFLDIVTARIGSAEFMNFIRNAQYSILVYDLEVGGKRIVGSFSEASGFAAASVGIFCFTVRLCLGNTFVKTAAPIALATLPLIVFSTSSTGIIALTASVLYLYAGAFVRLVSKTASVTDIVLLFVCPLVVLSAIAGVALDSGWTDWARSQMNALVLEKASTASGIERQMLNSEAWRVFCETYGLGTGVGSVRASSFILACLGTLGALGTAFFAIFLGGIFLKSNMCEPGPLAIVCSAARAGCFGLCVGSALSGLHTDLGLPFFVFAAMAYASPARTIQRSIRPLPTNFKSIASRAGGLSLSR